MQGGTRLQKWLRGMSKLCNRRFLISSLTSRCKPWEKVPLGLLKPCHHTVKSPDHPRAADRALALLPGRHEQPVRGLLLGRIPDITGHHDLIGQRVLQHLLELDDD